MPEQKGKCRSKILVGDIISLDCILEPISSVLPQPHYVLQELPIEIVCREKECLIKRTGYIKLRKEKITIAAPDIHSLQMLVQEESVTPNSPLGDILARIRTRFVLNSCPRRGKDH